MTAAMMLPGAVPAVARLVRAQGRALGTPLFAAAYSPSEPILAAQAGEVAAVIQMACSAASTLRAAVLAHPTMAEGLNELFASWTD